MFLMSEPDTDCVQDYRRRIATSNVLMFLIKQNRLESVLLQGLSAVLLLQMSFPDMGWVHTHPTTCAKLDSPCAQWTVDTIVRFCRVADTDIRCHDGLASDILVRLADFCCATNVSSALVTWWQICWPAFVLALFLFQICFQGVEQGLRRDSGGCPGQGDR